MTIPREVLDEMEAKAKAASEHANWENYFHRKEVKRKDSNYYDPILAKCHTFEIGVNGAELRKARLAAGMTQKRAAKRLGTPSWMLRMWERNVDRVSIAPYWVKTIDRVYALSGGGEGKGEKS